MKDSRLQQALAALDDARTTFKDLLDEGIPESAERTLLVRAYDDTNRAIKYIKVVAA